MIAWLVAASLATASAPPAPLVLPPVSFPDASGRGPDASMQKRVEQALADAASSQGAHTPAAVSAAAPQPSTAPDDIAALAAAAAKAADELDTKNGVRLLRQLIEVLQTRLVDVGDTGGLANAHLSLASLYLAMREELLAKAELDAAARLRPNAELDMARWSPQVVEAFAAAQVRVRAEGGADLDVTVDPPAAAVFVDGVRVGEAPLSLPVRRGVHLLWLGSAGHTSTTRVVDVEAGSRAKVDVALVALPSWDLEHRLAADLGDGRRAEAVALARELAKIEHASVVVATALVEVPGGICVLLANADDEPRLAVVTLDAALTGASAALSRGLIGLGQPAAAFSGGVLRIRGDHAPDPDDVHVDAKRALVGIVGQQANTAATAPATRTLPTTAAPTSATTNGPALAADDGGGFPWLAVGGGAIVLAAVGAGVALAVFAPALFQTPGATITDPDKTRFSITVAP